ncbi:stage II sporulation protein E (SpoIIE) [Mycolicibacterium mageritense DSM 44476 = CIP 104973]|uniref:Histidine kinase/HSP90-like ATPase domain-containing protein n=1 Tax=Mycolicibacterium mageritense TaxID=53462 RepID=A0ABM7HVL1_MYCME|nr:ATP-binding protein [Mycolicibacterium mageritense]MCC9181550.1 ATP-binding protein [Mycolicibacterium mageritense]BBX34636.1 hypothetical protein MMAGJ_39180 [Mycolicibacterium mageritense]CDO20845.1 stage II sporulation protein E (SpoIIE) [Mycolicibacterium mageritense DSM 44476 = CIP 104973]
MGAFEHCDNDEFVLVLPATAANAAEVRHRLAEWLHTRAMPTSTIADVVLAVYEACANCVEHAYQDVAAGPMRINATPTPEGVVVRVTDYGTWQPRTANLRGGRGIALMRTMSDTLTLTRTASETTVTMQFRWAEESTAPSSQAGADINPPHSAAAEPPLQVSG